MNESQRVRCFQYTACRYGWKQKFLRNDQKSNTKRFVLIIDGDVLEFLKAKETKPHKKGSDQRTVRDDISG